MHIRGQAKAVIRDASLCASFADIVVFRSHTNALCNGMELIWINPSAAVHTSIVGFSVV